MTRCMGRNRLCRIDERSLSMSVRVAINGFGRVGRCAFRSAFERTRHRVGRRSTMSPTSTTLAHLLRHDTRLRAVPGRGRGRRLDARRRRRRRSPSSREPIRRSCRGRRSEVDVVLECTGRFRTRADAAKHLDAGARKVIISAPGKGRRRDDRPRRQRRDLRPRACTTSSRTRRARRTASRRSRRCCTRRSGSGTAR